MQLGSSDAMDEGGDFVEGPTTLEEMEHDPSPPRPQKRHLPSDDEVRFSPFLSLLSSSRQTFHVSPLCCVEASG